LVSVHGVSMAGKRKRPKLWFDGKYFKLNIYKPDGKRTTISFGHQGDRPESEIRIACERWLNLYEQHPHKVLSYKNPYDAIEQIINPTNILSIGDLIEKYEAYLKRTVRPTRHGMAHPDLTFVKRVRKFLSPYEDWSIDSFGPDELYDVRKALVNHEYTQGKAKKKYVRRGINDTINWIWKNSTKQCSQMLQIEYHHFLAGARYIGNRGYACSNNRIIGLPHQPFRQKTHMFSRSISPQSKFLKKSQNFPQNGRMKISA